MAEELVAAIRANDAEGVRTVLAQHPELRASINEPLQGYGFEEPAILAAVHKQNREMIDVLLEAGANVNERSRWWAGSFGVLDFASPELSEYLISRGATLDIHSAARLGKIEEVRAMLARDPGLVHARGGDGQFPLHFAGTVEIARMLLEHGADVNARDIDHESTAAQFMVCQQPPRHGVVKFLITQGSETDILMASAIGDRDLVEKILNDDPDTIRVTVSERYFPRKNPQSGGVIYIYGFGHTKSPHILAHEFGHQALFELLMQRSPGWLRLVQAADTGDEGLFRELLGRHPEFVSRLTGNAARRIVGTAVRNNDRALRLLVEAGWPVDAKLDNGQTALHYAAWHGNREMVQTLLEHGAPHEVSETEHGGTPLGWALYGSLNGWYREKGDYPRVVQALLDAGAALPPEGEPIRASTEVLEVIRRQREAGAKAGGS